MVAAIALGRVVVDVQPTEQLFVLPQPLVRVEQLSELRDVVRAGRLERRRGDLRKTHENHSFYQVFRMFALARLTRRSAENRSRHAS